MTDEPSSAVHFGVVCPACEGEAQVEKPANGAARVACPACGFAREQTEDPRQRYGMQRIYSGAVDPYFGLRLRDQ